jgi:hypothetical protein
MYMQYETHRFRNPRWKLEGLPLGVVSAVIVFVMAMSLYYRLAVPGTVAVTLNGPAESRVVSDDQPAPGGPPYVAQNAKFWRWR